MTSHHDHPAATVRIRSEEPADVGAIGEVVGAAFASAAHSAPPVHEGGPPGEVTLLDWLREDDGWLPRLSLVAVADGRVVGHVVCTRGSVDGVPALGLGPLSVLPDRQREGIGAALMREVLARSEEYGEPLVALLGDPAYYSRFGFVPSTQCGIEPPEAEYGDYFQVRTLGSGPHPRGRFTYAAPFSRL